MTTKAESNRKKGRDYIVNSIVDEIIFNMKQNHIIFNEQNIIKEINGPEYIPTMMIIGEKWKSIIIDKIIKNLGDFGGKII